jgi:hypothetical protein
MCLVNKYVSCVQLYRQRVCAAERVRPGFPAIYLAKTLLLVGLSGCARAPNPSTVDESFRRIQEHEHTLSLGQAALGRTGECEPAKSATEDEVCAASAALCAVARPLSDRDAEARCARAEDSCAGARERTRMLCATNAPAP